MCTDFVSPSRYTLSKFYCTRRTVILYKFSLEQKSLHAQKCLYLLYNSESPLCTFVVLIDHVDACMRRQGCEYTSPTLSLQLEEYDDPDAKMHPQPYCLPLVTITPPLTPSIQEVVMKQENSNIMVMGSCAKKKVYETVMPQEDSVHGVVFKSNGEVVLYDTITDSVQPVQGVYETIESQYHFVPNDVGVIRVF